MVGEPVPCALVVVMLELLGPVKVELVGLVKLELLVAVMLEPVAAMLEPVAARLQPVTGPPVHNLEPVESDGPALLVKQAV